MIKLYSEIIKKSAVFSSSNIFQTMNDIRVYKHRIEYMRGLYEKYIDFEFCTEAEKERHKNFNDQMEHICSCGTFLTFNVLESDNTVGKLTNGNFCRQRICPLCQRRRSLKLFSNIQQILEPVKNKYSFIHLSLTVPSVGVENVKNSITDIFNNSKKLFNMPKYKKAFKGIIRSLEVTMNMNTFKMHPHLHCLILVNKSYFTSRDYIKHSEILTDWGCLIGCSFPQVHLRKCTDLCSALREVVKYAAKPIDTESENPDGFTDFQAISYYMNVASALKNRRLVQTFGTCSELSKAFHIDLNDDEITSELPEFSETHCYTYNQDIKNFVADIVRTPEQINWNNPPQYILDRIKKRNKKLLEYKKKIVLKNSQNAFKRHLSHNITN